MKMIVGTKNVEVSKAFELLIVTFKDESSIFPPTDMILLSFRDPPIMQPRYLTG